MENLGMVPSDSSVISKTTPLELEMKEIETGHKACSRTASADSQGAASIVPSSSEEHSPSGKSSDVETVICNETEELPSTDEQTTPTDEPTTATTDTGSPPTSGSVLVNREENKPFFDTTMKFLIWQSFCLAVPISEICIASEFWNECPGGRLLTVLLLVAAILTSLTLLAQISRNIARKRGTFNERNIDAWYTICVLEKITKATYIVCLGYLISVDQTSCNDVLFYYTATLIGVALGVIIIMSYVERNEYICYEALRDEYGP